MILTKIENCLLWDGRDVGILGMCIVKRFFYFEIDTFGVFFILLVPSSRLSRFRLSRPEIGLHELTCKRDEKIR